MGEALVRHYCPKPLLIGQMIGGAQTRSSLRLRLRGPDRQGANHLSKSASVDRCVRRGETIYGCGALGGRSHLLWFQRLAGAPRSI